jgi:hypothetical protein
VKSISKNYSGLAALQNNLGNIFKRRFERTGKMEKAIRLTERAVESISEGYPDLAAL